MEQRKYSDGKYYYLEMKENKTAVTVVFDYDEVKKGKYWLEELVDSRNLQAIYDDFGFNIPEYFDTKKYHRHLFMLNRYMDDFTELQVSNGNKIIKFRINSFPIFNFTGIDIQSKEHSEIYQLIQKFCEH